MRTNPTVVFPEAKRAVVEELEIPRPGPGQVLLKSSRTMISIGTEMTAFCGDFPPGSTWEKFFGCPYYPGYNNIGVVVEVGPGVDKALLGKRLATGGGHAAYVLAGSDPGKSAGELQAGGKGEWHEVPEGVGDDHAAFFTIPKIVMNGIRNSHVQWGECAVVYGLGLLGQFAVRFCRECGAAPVLGVDVSPERLALLPKDAAVVGVDPRSTDVAEAVRGHNHGRLADVVFEVTGNATLIERELTLLRQKGRLLLLSSPRQKVVFDFEDFCAWPSYTIIGSHNFSHPVHPQDYNPWTMDRHVELFFDLVLRGALDMESLVSRRVGFAAAPQVYQDLLADRSKDMGIIFNWDAAE